MYQYGRNNLAHVHVMMQSPYITKIKRDVAMTFTSYIASAGGLIGLCIGFSFISGIEILFWLCCCCFELKKKVWPKRGQVWTDENNTQASMYQIKRDNALQSNHEGDESLKSINGNWKPPN